MHALHYTFVTYFLFRVIRETYHSLFSDSSNQNICVFTNTLPRNAKQYQLIREAIMSHARVCDICTHWLSRSSHIVGPKIIIIGKIDSKQRYFLYIQPFKGYTRHQKTNVYCGIVNRHLFTYQHNTIL